MVRCCDRWAGRALGLLIGVLAATGAARAEDGVALRRALADVGARDWAGAAEAARTSGPLAADIVDWHRLRAGRGVLADFAAFAQRHGDWPGMALLRERAEGAMTATTPPGEVIAWFGDDPPLTGNGLRRLIAALHSVQVREAAEARLAPLWAAGAAALSPEDEAALMADWGAVLAAQDGARATSALDRGEWQVAQRALPRLSEPSRALAQLRIDLQSGVVPDAAPRLAALPPEMRGDGGLALDLFRRAVKGKDRPAAQALMLAQSTSAEGLHDPAAWAALRADYARATLREGDAALALRLAGPHFLTPAHPLWTDLEWLAGYAALRAGDLPQAKARFASLGAGSASAITQARALYWQARVARQAGDTAAETDLMTQAARHQSTFYGQLAAEAAGIPMDTVLAGQTVDDLPDWRGSALRRDDRFQAAVWLFLAGQPDLAQRFLLHMAETAAPEDIGRMARLMADFGQTHHALRLAKAAATKGAVYPAVLFPLTGLERERLDIPPELAMAIARRESEFNPRAASGAGARGLMQVMPGTGRDIAREVGLPFDLDALSSNGAYNALYGATYLRKLRARFGPSIALVAAGYNAGPGRSAQWVGSLGDIRAGADPVDWVEAIPFDETRNYVMRVAEALPVYRARIAGRPVPWTTRADLTGDGITSIPIPRPVLTLATSVPPPANPRAAAWGAYRVVTATPESPALPAAAVATGGAPAARPDQAASGPAATAPALPAPTSEPVIVTAEEPLINASQPPAAIAPAAPSPAIRNVESGSTRPSIPSPVRSPDPELASDD